VRSACNGRTVARFGHSCTSRARDVPPDIDGRTRVARSPTPHASRHHIRERALMLVFLRRYVIWCAKARRFDQLGTSGYAATAQAFGDSKAFAASWPDGHSATLPKPR